MANFTTAQLRTLAREAEARLDWQAAGRLWIDAVANYPVKGALADLDKAKMMGFAKAAFAMANEN